MGIRVIALDTTSYKSKRREIDDIFVMNEADTDTYVGAGLVAILDGGASETQDGGEGSDGTDPETLWKKKISPEEYLEKYPTGPAAALANEILAYREAMASGDEGTDGEGDGESE